MDRLDPDYAFQQVETFARTVDLLDRMPRGEIGIVPFNLSTVIGDLL
ncbi:hypothetical protein NE852_00575 (plasmid) [Rhizobium sp. Pop5]|nr:MULTISPECIES: hypothetical protein [unclassified Rhizobium]EJZ17782.1 hypothetical protein RCCGEPOP_29014 [Rhizobium sp. Pop5]UVD54947.1 hypothetical protein NE852_00575 [Rhizobium sp. Pop5]